jgi:two-component system chemotaxis response regulator CheY
VTRKVLIVDDSSLSRKAMRRILESAKYNVVEASEGLAALELYFLEKPDAVMLDLVMTGMYGLDVLVKLREMDSNAKVIIASADIQSSTKTLSEEAGAAGMITKPLVASEVLEVLEKVLEGGATLGT